MGRDVEFTDIVFSWSLEDIFSENLLKHKVEKIPETFESVEHYMSSYVPPLLEETRAKMCSSMQIISTAPCAEVIAFKESKPIGSLIYDVQVEHWRNRFSDCGKEPYKTLPGDIIVLTDAKPETVSDLLRVGRTWTFATVSETTDKENEDANAATEEENKNAMSTHFKVKASKPIAVEDEMRKSLHVIFLINVTTNKRIWNALHLFGNLKIIKEVLCPNSVIERNCSLCPVLSDVWGDGFVTSLSSYLNESQTEAVLGCLQTLQCNHKSTVELIWGPPGTGKTKTISVLLLTLLRMKYRSVACAPTNVAITEVATRVLKLLKEFQGMDSGEDRCCSVGDLLLFGNKQRLKVNPEIEDIYLDHRVQRLTESFGSFTGWQHCFTSMIDFLQDCVLQYRISLENELIGKKENCSRTEGSKLVHKSFLLFARERFKNTVLPLKSCVFNLCTHIPRSYFGKNNFQNVIYLVDLLDSLETLLFSDDLISEELEELFSHPEVVKDSAEQFSDTSVLLCLKRSECLSVLKTLNKCFRKLELPSSRNEGLIREFCFQTASLIFCTATTSCKLHQVAIEPLDFIVIDEAAQLRECESTIPLQLPGIRHAILIGDEFQLPAMVESNISDEAGFGRSLFERLKIVGHPKYLLNMQYRMHPSISCFPNSRFYHNQVLDAPKVKHKNYKKKSNQSEMFGPYAFINITTGTGELENVGHSWRNMVEVAVVMKLVRNLHKDCALKQKLSIGIISPYAAQVAAIQEKLGRKYDNIDGFTVKVKSVDGFQGGEEDIVIISTVRSDKGGQIGFLANPQRTNVALTRARHCLWILGNARTLSNSGSVWEAIVHNAKDCRCFFNANDDKEFTKVILEVKKEYDQLDDLLNADSAIFSSAKWKVLFSDNFRKSFGKLPLPQLKMTVLYFLVKLSSGWRPKRSSVDIICEKSSMVLKQFKVEGLYILCSVDLAKELRYIQVLKAWDLLPLEDIQKLVKRLDSIFDTYTRDFIGRCNKKRLEGDLEVPNTWTMPFDIIRYESHCNNENGSNSSGCATDIRRYAENSKVSDSLLLMKFYSLSSGVVNHLLSDCDGRELDLPFEVTDQEAEIVLFDRSTFILGRSGTGKTTVLTMKLFKKEQLYHMATKGYDQVNDHTFKDVCRRNNVEDDALETKETVLHQLFVTVSPKLCYAVKHHVSQLKW